NFSIADIANQLAEWMRSEKIGSAKIVGHSLGGYVILELVKNHFELVEAFVLFHSTAFADAPEKRATRNKVIEFVQKNGVEQFADSFVPQLFYIKNHKHLGAEIEEAVKTARQTPLKTLIDYTQAMRDRADCIGVLKSFNGPILFIAGDRDTSVPLEKSKEQIPMIQKGTTAILRDTGHMGMFESREESLEIIQRFLSNQF
ncbi:MAG: alpha/beta hydrolase, partial [Bacteroidota bacterium]